jgi:hypothetical protein
LLYFVTRKVVGVFVRFRAASGLLSQLCLLRLKTLETGETQFSAFCAHLN